MGGVASVGLQDVEDLQGGVVTPARVDCNGNSCMCVCACVVLVSFPGYCAWTKSLGTIKANVVHIEG